MNQTPTTIDLRLFATLAKYRPQQEARQPIRRGMTVAQLMQALDIPASEVKLIFIDGVRAESDSPLQGGERVGLFPPVGGG
ncbi:MoaD/ThiS family protein [Desulfatitalea alkaliphila]|uniref:MoaD/ThiS family protein n=1 Tax=Desulfatitalea alkaliphila TaxID=2929485 RepID=A0AA41R633_9BACT|nr:MoaD/ThiS family protein [Desulfatitalea alkaliphila]MCJ8501760.1 MoaD/ThiS family protein [Desulfatitalea alkaliphila]